MKEIESKISSLPSLQLNCLLFAVDFVGLGDSKQGLQDMINGVHPYSNKWHFEANVTKYVHVIEFSGMKRLLMVNGSGETLPCHTDYYKYLEVKFTYNDIGMHI